MTEQVCPLCGSELKIYSEAGVVCITTTCFLYGYFMGFEPFNAFSSQIVKIRQEAKQEGKKEVFDWLHDFSTTNTLSRRFSRVIDEIIVQGKKEFGVE